MEALLVSTGVVALGEMGDKTQLLALLLAAKFKRPIPIILGIFTATLANHTLAGALGAWIAAQLGAQIMRWVVGLGFIGMAGWVLIPDKAGSIREAADICRNQGGTIFSILGSYAKVPAGKRELVMRVDCPSTDALRAELSKKFGEVSVETD